MTLAALLLRRSALCAIIVRHDRAWRIDRADQWMPALRRVTRAIEAHQNSTRREVAA